MALPAIRYLLKLTFGVIVMLYIPLHSSAQQNNTTKWTEIWSKKGGNFYEIRKDFYRYWEGRKIGKGKGFKPFKRWEAYMEPRVFPTGDISLPSTTYVNYLSWLKLNPQELDHGSRAGGWISLGPVGKPAGPSFHTGAGRLNFIRFQPGNSNIVYVGGPDGGLWKSTNAGNSWTTNTDFLTVIGVADLAIDPVNSNIMYLATGDIESDRATIGVLKTIDGGVTWNTTGFTFLPSDGYKISKLLMHPSNPSVMIVSTNAGVFKTTDGWNTWSQKYCCASLTDMEFKPGDPNTMYACGTELFRSTDNGDSWSPVTSGLPSSNVSRIALGVSEGNSSYVYALIGKASDQSFLGLYRSTNSGTSFSLRSSSPNLLGYESDGSDSGGQAFYDLSIAVSPTNAEIVTTGGVNHWQSTNGGTNWNILTHWNGENGVPFTHADIHEINYLPGSSTTFFSCNDGGLFKTTNGGTTWSDLSNNLTLGQQTEIGLSQTDANLYIAGHQDNGTNLHSGSTWTNVSGGDGADCFFSTTSNDTIYYSYVNATFYRSDDGGANYNEIVTGLSGTADFYSRWYQDPVNSNILYAAGRDILFSSQNKGDNWDALVSGTGSGSIKAVAVAPSDHTIVYIINSNAVSKSTDSGASFSNMTGTLPIGNASLTDIIVSNTNADHVWVCFSGYSDGNKIFKTTDGGTTWINISDGLPNIPMNSLVYKDESALEEIYVGADIGVYYFNNTLVSWLPYTFNMPNVAVKDLEIYYPTSKLRAGTYGRGTWQSDLYDASADCSIVVVNASDDGPGSLRRTIACAPENSTISFDAGLVDGIGNDTIYLTSGPILISKNISLIQSSGNIVKIKAVTTGPIFTIAGSKSLWLEYVNLISGMNANNRAIQNNGNLTLKNVNIYQKAAFAGTGSPFTNMGNVTVMQNVNVINN
ncbi:MAG: hypothetical protein ABJC12_04155 [Saprospiraceae bacterium]